ncbi:MAG: TetR family transcriptional regulator [Lewinella sp.]|nr:TetR family transcriptional regulator [Lewinella sp.]
MEAAAELFRDKGYSATSMRDLAQAVHLQASSLYNHIQSKQEILREICFANARRFLAGITAIEAEYATATERVRALLELHIQVAVQDFTSITSFNDEWRHLDAPALEEFMTLRRAYEQRFIGIIQAGIEAGEFKAVEPRIALYTLLSSIRWVYDWFKPNQRLTIDDVRASVQQLLLSGLSR